MVFKILLLAKVTPARVKRVGGEGNTMTNESVSAIWPGAVILRRMGGLLRV